MKKQYLHLGNLMLVVGSFVLTILMLEFAVRIIWGDEATNWNEFRSSQPEPYQQSEYFNDAFIAEAIKGHIEWINPPGTRIIYPENFDGEYITVKNNERITTDEPEQYEHSIYLFGGSTMFCGEVPDKYTIASYIQRMMNQEYPNRFKVRNFGVTSVNSSQQLEKLKKCTLNANDIVLFYGGVNDGLLFTTGRVDGWIMGESFVKYEKEDISLIQRIQFKVYRWFHKSSKLVERFINPFSYELPSHLRDTIRVQKLKDQLFSVYNQTMQEADSICESNHAQFINIIQPNIFTRSNRTHYEERLINNKFLIPDPWQAAIKFSYPVLNASQEYLDENQISSYDLTGVFDNRSGNYYLDYCHLADGGNEIVASGICRILVSHISDLNRSTDLILKRNQ